MNMREAIERANAVHRRLMDASNTAWLRMEQGGWLCRCGYANLRDFPCCTHCGELPPKPEAERR